MIDPQAEWADPRVVQVRALEEEAHRLSCRIHNELGPGEAADLAYNTRIALSKMLAPYRRSMGEQYRRLREP